MHHMLFAGISQDFPPARDFAAFALLSLRMEGGISRLLPSLPELVQLPFHAQIVILPRFVIPTKEESLDFAASEWPV